MADHAGRIGSQHSIDAREAASGEFRLDVIRTDGFRDVAPHPVRLRPSGFVALRCRGCDGACRISRRLPSSEPSSSPPDRRRAVRRIPCVGTVLPAMVDDETGRHRCYIFLMDLSQGGLRLASHYSFSDGVLELRIVLAESIPLQVRVRWRRAVQDAWVLGLEFVLSGELEHQYVARFLRLVGEREQRRAVRLECQLSVEMAWAGYHARFTGTTVDISMGGLRLFTDTAPAELSTVAVTIHLEDGEAPPTVIGSVAWLLHERRYLVGVRFIRVPATLEARLLRFIECSIARLIRERLARTDPYEDPEFEPRRG
ncbi:MAG: PilZ domain-containing protein [Candidatus Xenobia bacterium]